MRCRTRRAVDSRRQPRLLGRANAQDVALGIWREVAENAQ
jgi:hypothetical protein